MIQPLNLQYLLVNTFSGNATIFLALALGFIAFLAAKFRMNTYSFLMIIAIFAVLMSPIGNWLLLLVILIAGFMIYFTIGRLFKT